MPARPANADGVGRPGGARNDALKPNREAGAGDEDSFANVLDAETRAPDVSPAEANTQSTGEPGGQTQPRSAAKSGKGAHASRVKSETLPGAAATPEAAGVSVSATLQTTNLALELSAAAKTTTAAADASQPTGEVAGAVAMVETPAAAATAIVGATIVGVTLSPPAATTAVVASQITASKIDTLVRPATPAAATLADPNSAAPQIEDPAATQPVQAAGSHAQAAPHAAAASANADPKPAAIDTTSAGPAPKTDAAPAATLAAPQTTTTMPVTAATPDGGSTPAALRAAPEAVVQVYHRIIERNDGRSQRFEMRLDPVELGRVDIRIEIDASKKVHAVLAAHDSAALSDLVKGQKGLEQALKDSGLDLADGGLKFELSADTGRSFSGSENRSRTLYEPGFFDGDRANLIALPATSQVTAAAQPSWLPQRLNLVA